MELGWGVPLEAAFDDGVLEGEKGEEGVGGEGGFGREGGGEVGGGALVGEDPEVEVGEEAGEVGEGFGGVGLAFDPEGGEELDWVLV